jgi:hypothetical protein
LVTATPPASCCSIIARSYTSKRRRIGVFVYCQRPVAGI